MLGTRHSTPLLLLLAAALGFASAQQPALDGELVLRNANGIEVGILPTGGCVRRLLVPLDNPSGCTPPVVDVMLGFDDEEQYRNGTSVSGCIVGRVGGRISGGNFTLDGETFELDTGKGGSYTMHGGGINFSRRQWEVESAGPASAVLRLDSPAGDQRFPGNLTVRVAYTLTDANELLTDITATADEPTPVNVFQHPYFNLGGVLANDSSILDHQLAVNASYYQEVDGSGAATGAFLPVAGTPLDFGQARPIGERINETAGGYSVSYLLRDLTPDTAADVAAFQAFEEPQLAATMVHPSTGLGLELLTTAPALVLFTGNFKGRDATKGGVHPGATGNKHAAVALEATMFPEGLNFPDTFPDLVLRPGQQYRNQVVWRFFQQAPTAPPEQCSVAAATAEAGRAAPLALAVAITTVAANLLVLLR